jgi:hypothetical protein
MRKLKANKIIFVGMLVVFCLTIAYSLASANSGFGENIGNIFKKYTVNQNTDEDTVIAKFGNLTITRNDIDYYKEFYSLNGEEKTDDAIIDSILLKTLLYEEAKKTGMEVSDDDVKENMEKVRNSILNNEEAHIDFLNFIKASGMTEDEYWENSFFVYKRAYSISNYKKNYLKPMLREKYKNLSNAEFEEAFNNYYKEYEDELLKNAKKYVEELNKKEKEETREILVRYAPTKLISKDERHCFNGGYLFLQQIYHELKLHKLCKKIAQKYKFKFNLDSILSRLVYGRILFPLSKLGTFEESKKFIEQPDFDLHQIYRALEYLAKETDFIQSSLYENSLKISKRNTGILYYDCTNFFFEIEEAKGKRQYGAGKDHKPNPIVQMGLFMDGDGIPLAFSINSGNTNEQQTLKPLKITKEMCQLHLTAHGEQRIYQ